ncbi:MAG: hypothetical protein RB296_04305 [Acidobacteriota bacterium]|jgi:anti-sigma factor ChrR (cupin superfamily)|nr:hypothetical protein [Acidobacteriota bacterium]
MIRKASNPAASMEHAIEDEALRELNREWVKLAPSSPCPDDSQLAALAEGRLDRAQREGLFLHLAECEACLDAYSLIREMQGDRSSPRAHWLSWKPLAVAASLVLVATSLYIVTPRGRGTTPLPHAAVGKELPEPGAKRSDRVSDKTFAATRHEEKVAAQPPPAAPPPAPEKSAASRPAPAEAKGRVSQQLNAQTEERQSPPMQKRAMDESTQMVPARSARPAMAETFGDRHTEIHIPVPGESLAAGRVDAWLVIDRGGRVSRIRLNPAESALGPLVSRALRNHRFPAGDTDSRSLHLVVEWNGESWRIQPSTSSNPGESVNDGGTSS